MDGEAFIDVCSKSERYLIMFSVSVTISGVLFNWYEDMLSSCIACLLHSWNIVLLNLILIYLSPLSYNPILNGCSHTEDKLSRSKRSIGDSSSVSSDSLFVEQDALGREVHLGMYV